MPIEFLCNVCQQRLSVPDGSAGKQAKCPNCSTVLNVPDPASQAVPDLDENDSPPPTRTPLAKKRLSTTLVWGIRIRMRAPSSLPDTVPTGMIDAGFAFSSAWQIFKTNAALLIGAYVIQMALNFGITFGSTFLQTIAGNVLGDPQSLFVLLMEIGTSLLNQVIQFWLTIGFIRITLATARNEPADLGMLFSGAAYLPRYIGAGILFGIATMVGFILLIIPGFYVLLTYWSYMYFIVDRNCGVFESFRLAGTHAAGNRLNVLLLGLLSIVLSILGLMACGVGLLVTAPLVMMMFAVAYLMMTGQPFVQAR